MQLLSTKKCALLLILLFGIKNLK